MVVIQTQLNLHRGPRHTPLPRRAAPGRAEVGREAAQRSREDPSPLPARSDSPLPDPRGPPGGGGQTLRHQSRGVARPGVAGRGRGRGRRRAAGEGKGRAPLTRPGAAPGPSRRLSRSNPERGVGGKRPGSSFHPEAAGPAGNDEGRGRPGPSGNRLRASGRDCGGKSPELSSRAARRLRSEQPPFSPVQPRGRLRKLQTFSSPMPGGYGVMGADGSMDYSVHEAWNEATNVYLVVILVSFGLFMYAKRNKRKIMRIFSLPPTAEALSEPNFYDTISKIRLRQQLEMYSISRKYDYQQPQNQADSVQLSLE